MKTKEKINRTDSTKKIKVQLDHCTYVTLSRMSSLNAWRKKFPDAKIMA